VEDPNVLVGLARPDDAGVVRVSDDCALVQTLDFFTPIVDDPRTFGRIAATNALSDVYAMGGRPVSALNVVCFPSKALEATVLREILEGGLDALREAGCPLVGGHSVDDPELKYGLSVTGVVHPDRFLTAAGAMAGDLLVLTKPLGTGAVTTGHKRGWTSASAMSAAVTAMVTLNRDAAEGMMALGAHAATDITGFGLIGHASDMVEGDDLDLWIRLGDLPILPEALELLERGATCGGLGRNRTHYEPRVDLDPNLVEARVQLAYDPQTSGGLLVALPADAARALVERLESSHPGWAAVVGEVVGGGQGRIRLQP
jgi:selenide,water dikinase